MLDFQVRVLNRALKAKEAVVDAFKDERGDTNFISVIIILVIVVALGAVFRKNIASIVNETWTSIFKETKAATNSSKLGAPTATFK